MLNLLKVAVTGGIASGKSTLCRYFAEYGAYAISADEIVHQLLSPQTDLGKQVVALLGKEIVVEGRISRKIIADKVFRDPLLLKSLEKQIHPEVQREIDKQYQKVLKENPNTSLFIAEVPLLFESGLEQHYDITIAVIADRSICSKRYHDKEEFEVRTQRLVPQEEKRKKADYCIENNGSMQEFKKATNKLFNTLIGNLWSKKK